MSKRSGKILILDMKEATENILSYTSGMSYDEFITDKKTVDAVLRNLTILGEAAKKVPVEISEKYKEIEWAKISRSRNIIVHDYFTVDHGIIWKIVQDYLPSLLKSLEQVDKEIN